MTEINLKRAPFSNGNGSAMGSTDVVVTQPLEQAVDIQPRDWDCLFSAVIERLQMTVSEQFASDHDAHAGDTLAAVTTSVRECLEALAQLQASIIYDRNRPTVIDDDALRGKSQLSAAMAQVLALNAATQQRALSERRLLLHDSLTGLPDGGRIAMG